MNPTEKAQKSQGKMEKVSTVMKTKEEKQLQGLTALFLQQKQA